MSRFSKPKHKTRSSKTKCFVFGCFGFSNHDHHHHEVCEELEEEDEGSVKISSKKSSRCWFSCSKFRILKRSLSNTKTVPVDASISGSLIQTPVAKAKVTSNGQPPSQTLADMLHHDTEHQQTRYRPDLATVRKDRNQRQFDSIKINTGKKRAMPISRTLHCRKNSRSQPGSPEPKFSSRPINPIMTSNSAPNLVRMKRRGDSSVHYSPNKIAARKSDAVAGMYIITVTLIIMILFGRVWAIACTSACFYFIPRFKMSTNEVSVKNVPNTSRELVNSSEYKKKVVLDGFLDRNHRRL